MALLVQERFVPSSIELPLVPHVDERNNVERIPEREAVCGEAARFDVFEMSRRVASETMPENPSAILSAIGLILFLLQRLPNKKRT